MIAQCGVLGVKGGCDGVTPLFQRRTFEDRRGIN